MIYFTADTHFGHANIIKYCDRPFASVEEMDATLIANWNSVVPKHADVYHLGDFAWTGRNRDRNRQASLINDYASALNGNIHLVVGNHDNRAACEMSDAFDWVDILTEIKYAKQNIVLCHYAMRTWNKSHFGSWQLYGHTHGTMPEYEDMRSLDVGVDSCQYHPISYENVLKEMKTRVFPDKNQFQTLFDNMKKNSLGQPDCPNCENGGIPDISGGILKYKLCETCEGTGKLPT